MFTEEQSKQLTDQCIRLMAHTQNVQDEIATLRETVKDQQALIERLSKDNLALVAKLDQLTGKTAPGTTCSA